MNALNAMTINASRHINVKTEQFFMNSTEMNFVCDNFKVNGNLHIKGDLYVEGEIWLNGVPVGATLKKL
jgi:phage baseplate assembly protein gpV